MRWEGCDLRGCSIGGGEGTSRIEEKTMRMRGRHEEMRGGWGERMLWRLRSRSPHPLPSSKPAGSREEVNNLAGGAWRGLEECWGFWGKFLGCFLSRSLILNFSCAVVWPALPTYQASAGWTGRDKLNGKWKFYHCNCLSCLFYCQCLIRPCGRRYSRINLRINV